MKRYVDDLPVSGTEMIYLLPVRNPWFRKTSSFWGVNNSAPNLKVAVHGLIHDVPLSVDLVVQLIP